MKLDVSRAIQNVAAGGGAAISGGANSQNTGTVNFSNSNGISFGLSNDGVMTAAHNGLTTAAQSNHSHGNPTLVLNNLSGTTASNSNGFTLSLSAAVPGAGGGIAAAAGSQTGTSGTIVFSNLNGITFGMSNSSVITAAHNGITTAMASNRGSDFMGTNTALTANGVSVTANSSGLSLNFPAFLTTAALSNHSHGNPTLNLTNITGTTASASNGLTLSLSGVAAQTTQTQPAGNIAGVGTTFGGANLSASMTFNSNGLNLSMSANAPAAGVGIAAGTRTATTAGNILFDTGNGITFGLNGVGGSVMTASHNGLTTAMQTGSQSQLWVMGNSSGTIGGTNISGTVFSNGMSLSAAAGGGVNPAASASNGSFNFTTLNFSNANNVTFGTSAGGIVTASVAAPGGGAGVTIGNYEIFPLGNNTVFTTLGINTIYFQRFEPVANVSFNNFEYRASGSTVSSTNSQRANYTFDYGVYSRQTGTASTAYSLAGSSQYIIQASFNSNTAAGVTISQGAGSFTTTSGGTVVMSLLTGLKHLYLPYTSTITVGGQYAIAVRMSSATSGNTGALRLGIKQMSMINNLTVGKFYASTVLATNASFVGDFNQGVYSVTSSNLPNTIALTGFTNAVSQMRQYIQLEN